MKANYPTTITKIMAIAVDAMSHLYLGLVLPHNTGANQISHPPTRQNPAPKTKGWSFDLRVLLDCFKR